jgi:hypothetical protein
MSFEKPWGNYLLEKIVETTAPESISFFPQTIAWKIIAIILITLIIKKAYQSWKTYQANAYRREALAWLAQCSLTNEADIRQLPALLRKTALLANEHNQSKNAITASKRRQEITKLSGESWTTWLDKQCRQSHFTQTKHPSITSDWTNERLLTQLAYVPKLDLNNSEFSDALNQLSQQIAAWIQHHQLSDEVLPQGLGEQT